MKNLLLTIAVLGVIVAALLIRGGTSAPASQGRQVVSPTFVSMPEAAASLGADPLTICGVGRPNQSAMLGDFQATSAADVHKRLPGLPNLPDLDSFTPPMTVVLFDKGVFNFPVPLLPKPGSQAYWEAPHTILCVFHDGISDFYADVDFSGWSPT